MANGKKKPDAAAKKKSAFYTKQRKDALAQSIDPNKPAAKGMAAVKTANKIYDKLPQDIKKDKYGVESTRGWRDYANSAKAQDNRVAARSKGKKSN